MQIHQRWLLLRMGGGGMVIYLTISAGVFPNICTDGKHMHKVFPHHWLLTHPVKLLCITCKRSLFVLPNRWAFLSVTTIACMPHFYLLYYVQSQRLVREKGIQYVQSQQLVQQKEYKTHISKPTQVFYFILYTYSNYKLNVIILCYNSMFN